MKTWLFLILFFLNGHTKAAEINLTVGTLGVCDYSTPQQAIDAINYCL